MSEERVGVMLGLSLGEMMRRAFEEVDCRGGVPPADATVHERLEMLEKHIGF